MLDEKEVRQAERNVGRMLRCLRKLNGLTIVEAATQIGITEDYLERLESADRPLTADHIRPIANLYLVDTEFLFLPFRTL